MKGAEYNSEEAKNLGLIDEIGNFLECIQDLQNSIN